MANWQATLLNGVLTNGSVLEVKGDHAIAEVNQTQHRLHRVPPHEVTDDASLTDPHESRADGSARPRSRPPCRWRR